MDETLATGRVALYGLLGRLLLGDWMGVREPAAAATPPDERLARLLALIRERDAFQIRVEYDNLFVVPGRYYVPLFERYYRDVEDVSALYQQVGFTLPERRGELPDHLGCALGFMQALLREEQAAARRGDSASAGRWATLRRDFVAAHLGAWVGQVRGMVQQHEPDGVYRLVLELVDDLIAYERALDAGARAWPVAAPEDVARNAAAVTAGGG